MRRVKAGQQGDAEEDDDVQRDVPHGHVQALAVTEVHPARQQVEVEPAQQAEREDLEHRVQCDQDGGGLPVAAGEVVPDDDHGDAAGETDDDQAGAVLGQVRQEDPRQREHDGGPDDPVDDQRGHHQLLVAGHAVESVVADLGEHRVHHHQQAERDRQGDTADLDLGERVVHARDEAAQAQADGHGEQDPHREVAVEGGELLDDRVVPTAYRSGGGGGLCGGHGQALLFSEAVRAESASAANCSDSPARTSGLSL